MSASRIRAVLFDLGGVLVELKYEQAIQEFLRHTPYARADIERLLTADPRTIDFEEGRLSAGEYFAYLQQAAGFTGDYEVFRRIWNGWIGECQPVAELVAALKPQYAIGIISNTNALHLRHVLDVFAFPKHVDRCIASCWVGCSKPAPRIYDIAIARLGVPANTIVYIDDRQDLVMQGQRLGLRAVHFTGHEPLMASLKELGVTWTTTPSQSAVSR